MKLQQKLRPLPGSVVLKFHRAITEKELEREDGTKTTIITGTDNTRYEIGELVALGEATDYKEALTRMALRERQQAGEMFPVRWLAGTCYGDYLPTGSGEEWLKDYRVYRYSELTVSIPTSE